MRNLMLALLALSLAGCVRYSHHHGGSHTSFTSQGGAGHLAENDQLEFTYRVEGANGIFDSDKVTLIFPDLRAGERNSFFLKDDRIAVQIAGEGRSTQTITHKHNKRQSAFTASYESGTNTITFCGRQVRLANRAQLILTEKQ